MKILDRYVLRSFLVNYLISFVVLIGMYIVLDMVFNFDELVERRGDLVMSNFQVVSSIASYYFFQSFLIFVHLSGVIPVVAAGFTLIRLSRFNELSAILAAGVPLLRIAAPIILATVLLQGLLAVDQEVVIPNIIPKLTPKHDELYQQAGSKSYPIQFIQDDKGWLLSAGRYTPAIGDHQPLMQTVDILEVGPTQQVDAHVLAESAEWDPNSQTWKLKGGRRLTGLHPSNQRSPERRVPNYKSNITPDEIALYHSGEYVTLLSLERINQLLQRPKIYGTIDLLRVKHFRRLQLVMNVVMILIAIPCLLTREPGKLKGSIIKCLVLIGLCMASYFIAYQIAGDPRGGPDWQDRWPAMVAFAPLLVFSVIAIYLLDRLATRDT